jgi:hypothetical protein
VIGNDTASALTHSMQVMFDTDRRHGEILRMHQITGDAEYLTVARRFSHGCCSMQWLIDNPTTNTRIRRSQRHRFQRQ